MSKKKKIIIILIVTFAIIGVIVGLLTIIKNRTKEKKSVDVYPVSELYYPSDMFEYSNYVYGYVDVSMEQNIYLASSQQIEEVKVKEGQRVKAGDVILVYDTTAQELALDLMRADVEIARAAVVVAERELEELKNITPVEELPEEPATEETTTEEVATPTDAPENIATPTDAPEEVPEVPEELPEIPEEDVYTKEELEEAIAAKEAEIRSLSIAYQLAQIDLQIMEYQNSNGEVIANFDGVVKTVIDEEEAILNSKPFIVISGDSGCTVNAEIGELSLETIGIGDNVEMYCYENGMVYTGTITEIDETPINSYYYDSAESYYPMKIIVENADDLSTGMGMDITIPQGEEDTDAFYLPLAYVAEENGQYYVLKDNNGVLEKVYVKTGKILWGDSIKIHGGIGIDDYIAFPHSKDAVEGAKTNQASAYDMYY